MAAVVLLSVGVRAELSRVGPSDIPSPPGHGFPRWYQDAAGVVLDLCIPESTLQLDPCLAALLPGDPLPPYSFPDVFLDEYFWFGADALIDLPGGGTALLVQALEAAFATGPATPGEQITFGRIRLRIDAPVAGNYTVIYPYGVQFFPAVQPGAGAINSTVDVGIGAPGDFSGALGSAIGPFLKPVDASGAPLPPVVIDGGRFLTDGVTPTLVQGSPFGTNFFQVCVDAPGGLDGQGTACVQTSLFTVGGKLHDGAIPSPLAVPRVTYARTASQGQLDVFAEATAGIGAASPSLSFTADGRPGAVAMAGPAGAGQYFGQALIAPDAVGTIVIPATVAVVNSADNPPTVVPRDVVDHVEILDAFYSAASHVITIVATSSDKVAPPALVVDGLPGSVTGSDALVPSGGADPAEAILTVDIGPVPPAAVTVRSAAGGSATLPVTVGAGPGAPAAQLPSAAGDGFTTAQDTPLTAPAPGVLANDSDPQGALLQAVLSTGPSQGALQLNGDGSFTYTPNAGFSGADTFTYVAQNGVANSAPATVSIEVTPSATTPTEPPPTVVDALTVARAEYRLGSAEWRVDGTGSVSGAVVTVRLGPGATGAVLGTALVDAAGAWSFRQRDALVGPGSPAVVTVESNRGATLLDVPVSVR